MKHTQDRKERAREFAAKRPIIGTHIDGKRIKYESIQEAARENHHGKKSTGSVWRVLVGERGRHHGWNYKYDGEGTPQENRTEQNRKAQETWRNKHPGDKAISNRMATYGLTKEEVITLIEISNCEICGKHVSGRTHHIDHDHDTGDIRGVLCGKCNGGIAMLGDNINSLEAAVHYLKQEPKFKKS